MAKWKTGSLLLGENFVRTVISVILASIVIFYILKPAAEAMFKSDTLQPAFKNLVNDINNLEVGKSKESFIVLEPSTAIIGFSKNKDYQCYGCANAPKDELVAQFKRPSNEQCKDSACICICRGLIDKSLLDLNCNKLQCEKLNSDIYPKIELGEFMSKKFGFGYSTQSSWQGGFFYATDAGQFHAAISGLPKINERKMVVSIEKKTIGDTTYAGVCLVTTPKIPCIQEQK